MNMRDLIPWGRTQAAPTRFREEGDPFMTLHREMNRLFDDIFRGFDFAPFGGMGRQAGWPSVEVVENDKDVRVSAELPGLSEKDVEVFLQEGVLTLRGEKRSEVEDKQRSFSERYYGRFERRIPLDHEVEQDGIRADFRNGVLAVTLPKAAQAEPRAKRIPVKGKAEETKH